LHGLYFNLPLRNFKLVHSSPLNVLKEARKMKKIQQKRFKIKGMNKILREKIELAPHSPGVYIFKLGEEVLYVGKARDLKNRLKNYLTMPEDPRISVLIKRANNIDYIITNSEEDALLLEANLIKIHKPRYNIRLKDDKKYPFIKITMEKFPSISLTRNLKEPGITIFGPYVNAQSVRRTIRAIRKIFPIRTCRYKLPSNKKIKPCIDYQIGKCLAPCIEGNVSEEVYNNIVQNVIKFLKGQTSEIIKELEERMKEAASRLEFEKAKIYRDELLAITKLSKEQVVSRIGGENKDVCVVYRLGKSAIAFLLKIREGILVDRESYFLEVLEHDSEEEILKEFIMQYYSSASNPPDNIIIDKSFEDLTTVKSALKINIRTAAEEEKKLIEMAYENAKKELEEEIAKKKGAKKVHPGLVELSELLHLVKVPERIEACDISQLFGDERVGSFVCFVKNRLSKSNYRKYKIKGEYIDDPQMIYEVVKRRLDDEPLPDVILIDGGITQLNAAKKAKEELKRDVPLIAFAKRFDDLYLEDGRRIMVPKRSHLFTLLKILRDEAHRFALQYHRKLRNKRLLEFPYKIEGVGPKTIEKLVHHFGSIKKIKEASLEELKEAGINKKVAESIYKFFHSQTKFDSR